MQTLEHAIVDEFKGNNSALSQYSALPS